MTDIPRSQEEKYILLIEDGEDDHEAIVRACEKAAIRAPVCWCRSGDEALEWLRGGRTDPKRAACAHPSLILLDLNMPGLDGRQLLEIVKTDGRLKRIPTIILTSSSSDKDILNCYQTGANAYLLKPVRFEDLVDLMRRFRLHWLETVLLPPPVTVVKVTA